MAPSKNDREARIARERLRAYQARQTVHATGRKRRIRDNWIAGIAVVVFAAGATVLQLTYFGVGPGKPVAKLTATATASATPTPTATAGNTGDVPAKTIAAGRNWTGTLTLNKTIKLGVTLNGKAAPQAVSSTISLVKKGYYTGLVCHRLTNSASFKVLQCGGGKSVATASSGGPGYSYGPIENAPKATASGAAVYPKGTIAMARSSDDAYSNGSQFFIVYGNTTIADDTAGGYSVIGTVTSGLNGLITGIADKGLTPTSTTSANDGTPKVATTITGFTLK